MSIFTDTFDVVVVGSGYAGYAAALTARRHVERVLLIGDRGDLLWESGRSFCPITGPAIESPDWDVLLTGVADRGGRAANWLDGAIAETVATVEVVAADLSVLYYATPVAVELIDHSIRSLRLATKSGPRTVTAHRWVDATEGGALARLTESNTCGREASSAEAYLYLQHADWASVDDHGALHPTAWPTERFAVAAVDPVDESWRSAILRRLAELDHALGPALS